MIVLFKPGTSHVVNGITCERGIFNEYGFEGLLDGDWFLTPEECYQEDEEKILEVVPKKQTG